MVGGGLVLCCVVWGRAGFLLDALTRESPALAWLACMCACACVCVCAFLHVLCLHVNVSQCVCGACVPTLHTHTHTNGLAWPGLLPPCLPPCLSVCLSACLSLGTAPFPLPLCVGVVAGGIGCCLPPPCVCVRVCGCLSVCRCAFLPRGGPSPRTLVCGCGVVCLSCSSVPSVCLSDRDSQL